MTGFPRNKEDLGRWWFRFCTIILGGGVPAPPGTEDLRVFLAGDINGSMSEDDQQRAALILTDGPPPQAGTFE